MVDIGGISGMLMGWVSSGVFWVIIAVGLTIFTISFLWVLKYRKLKYPVLEFVSFGNGKFGFNKKKAGIFRSHSAFFNLWDYGNELRFKLDDGRQIQCASKNDMQDIFGRKGFIVITKDDDPKIVVPLSKLYIKNKILLAEIAPADFRDASVNIMNEAKKETQGWAEKYLPYILIGGIVVFFIISMILASQFFNRTVDKAGEIILQAGKQAGNIQAAPAGTAP